jgi:hypothetical protein
VGPDNLFNGIIKHFSSPKYCENYGILNWSNPIYGELENVIKVCHIEWGMWVLNALNASVPH